MSSYCKLLLVHYLQWTWFSRGANLGSYPPKQALFIECYICHTQIDGYVISSVDMVNKVL